MSQFTQTFELKQVSDGACTLRMPNSKNGSFGRMQTLPNELSTEDYMINFDYDQAGKLISIEVVCFD